MVIQRMEILVKFKNYIQNTFEQGAFGLSILEVITIIGSFVLALVIRGLFAKIIVSKIKKVIQKTGNKVDDHLFDSLAPPLKTLPIIFVFILMGLFVNTDSQLGLLLEKINQTLVQSGSKWAKR